MDKDADAFRTISEAAEELDVPQHVLRFWETRFTQIKPMKRGGGRRYYRPEDMELLRSIRYLLYGEGYTIKGVQRILKEQGVRAVIALRDTGATPASHAVSATPPAEPHRPEHTPPALSVVPGSADRVDETVAVDAWSEEAELHLRAALAEIIEARRVLEAALAA